MKAKKRFKMNHFGNPIYKGNTNSDPTPSLELQCKGSVE